MAGQGQHIRTAAVGVGGRRRSAWMVRLSPSLAVVVVLVQVLVAALPEILTRRVRMAEDREDLAAIKRALAWGGGMLGDLPERLGPRLSRYKSEEMEEMRRVRRSLVDLVGDREAMGVLMAEEVGEVACSVVVAIRAEMEEGGAAAL